MFSSLLHRLQDVCLQAATPITRRCVRLAPKLLLDALPCLGSVLYVPMHPHASSVWLMPRGLLVADMRLAPLLQARWLVAASTITVDGPREWIECMDRDRRLCARLYLLPDTDYLAWDALLANGEPATNPDRRPTPAWPASAQLLCFHRYRLGGLDVLDGETSTGASPLSTQLAGHIARLDVVSRDPHAGHRAS
ncbi:MAG: hypothetical protein ABI870_00345 [Rhodanobacter sp.]